MLRRLFTAAAVAALLSLAALAPGCRQASAANGIFEHTAADYRSNDYWFDGRAEINLYEATLTYYGAAREAESVVHILVTEDHEPDLLVKADDWRQPGLVKMLKFNYLQRVRTGVYAYRQMASIFFEQESGRFAKMTYGSQEWCGNSFKEIVNFRDRDRFDFNTYWDGQGNGEYEVDFPEGMVPYDSLPVQLRMLDWKVGLEAGIKLLPSQFSSRVQQPEIVQGSVKVESEESLEVPAGSFQAYRVSVTRDGTSDVFWFEKGFPHRMLQWERPNGDRLRLEKSEKLPYWQLNQPGDESALD